jgi:prepilin-type N-terminal cleavage/methylation domain-containing protein
MCAKRAKSGFTLVEMLAVIFVVAMIVALMLPALALSAAQARRVECENKLRQLGLALNNFYSSRKQFPTVQFNFSATASSVEDCRPADASGGKSTTGYSWLIRVLPHLEEVNYYNNLTQKSNRFTIRNGPFDPSLVTRTFPTQHVSCVPLTTAICPDWAGNAYTHNNMTVDAGRAANPDEPADQGAPEYAAVDAATPGNGDESFKGRVAPTCYKAMVGTHMVKGMPTENGGMALSGQGLTMNAFGDGTSKTIMLCESKECGYASWYDGTLNWLVGNDPNQPAPGADDKPPWINAAVALNKGFDPKAANSVPYLKKDNSSNKPQNDIWWGPSSDHANGIVYHLIADGHTISITDACDPATYLGLITRDGGERIDDSKIK